MKAACTDSPSMPPTESPTISPAPSASPSESPTLCSESYLTSEDLNIALVIDLSFSTYEKEFSSENPVGDLNNDGKGNTILDAQIAAIQELLVAIADSPSLRNSNSEINLISFSTDAEDHGTWHPLNDAGDSYNPDLMDYIKDNLWAPTSNDEVYETNNGFTNFDAALDVTVDYFTNRATPGRKNLLVFLSDGEPNVRGDGDNEGYCTDTTTFWMDSSTVHCGDLGLAPGERHRFCRGNDPTCAETEVYQDCVRGPNECMNADAVTQYDSEIDALTELNVERLAIGVGNESNIEHGSALWMIDNNPAKHLGVLPLQALDLDELSQYLSSLCILNTDPPTGSPSAAPTASPTTSPAPSGSPSAPPTTPPSVSPTIETRLPPVDTFGEEDPDDDTVYPPNECPSDIHLLSQVGTTPLPEDTIRILDQNTTHVKVEVRQKFTPETASIDTLYYQYENHSSKCYERNDFEGEDTVIITMKCRVTTPLAVLDLWVADDLQNGVLAETDDASIPRCCHPSEPDGTPVSHYVLYIKCETDCPDATE